MMTAYRMRMRRPLRLIHHLPNDSPVTSGLILLCVRAPCLAQIQNQNPTSRLHDAGHLIFASVHHTSLQFHRKTIFRRITSSTDRHPSVYPVTDLREEHRMRRLLPLSMALQKLLCSPRTSHSCKHGTTTIGPPCPHERASDRCQRRVPDMRVTRHQSAPNTPTRPTCVITTATVTAIEIRCMSLGVAVKRIADIHRLAMQSIHASDMNASEIET